MFLLLTDDATDFFKGFVVGESGSFCECLAEFLRADLVDHDAFVKLLGEENYNKVIKGLKGSNRVDNFNTQLQIGDNNEITITRSSDGMETTYVGGIRVKEIITSEDGTVTTTEYYPNGEKKSTTETYPDGRMYHYEWDEKGNLIRSKIKSSADADIVITEYEV